MTELRSLAQADHDQLTAARRIYEDSFPLRQREPFDELIASIQLGDSAGWVQLDGESTIGIAVVLPMSVGWQFLEYFAVDSSVRDKGYGTALWEAMLREDAVRRLIFEVEDPADAPDPAERELRRRRIIFYQRLGATLVEYVHYVVPDVVGAKTEPLLLMWHDPTRTTLDPPTLATLLKSLYVEGYGLPPDHDLLTAALKSLDEPR